METLIKDLRFGIRSLAKRPGFTAIAVLTLSLGIGASTAIFSVVDGVLLRSLPYPEPDQIVQLREVNQRGVRIAFAEPNFLDVRARSHSFQGVAQYSGQLATITGGSEPVRASAYTVSADFFNVLGVKPIVGRTFAPEETKAGGAPVAVVSYGFWQRLLGGKPDLTGTSLRVSDQSLNVIGVMPAEFAFPRNAEIWVPREMFPGEISRSAHNWSVVARIRPDVTAQQAYADVSAIAKQLKQEFGKDMDGVDFAVVPQQEYMVGNVRGALLMIFAAVGFLLLVACANVANLLLAQVTTRQREFSVRAALGATRSRLARQFITENLLLVLIAGALGVLFAFWGVNLLLGLNQQALPRMSEIGVNARVVGFTLGLSVVIAVLLGIVPLLRFSTKDLEASLREAGGATLGSAGQHSRNLLVVAQMALTLILLVGAGLLGKSFYRLLQIDPGFRTESAVAMELSLPDPRMDESRYKKLMESYDRLLEHGEAPAEDTKFTAEEERQRLFQQQLLERLGNTPGVIAAGTINYLPLAGGGPDGNFLVNNNPARQGQAEYRLASAGYFAAMGIPLLRGRTFDATDQVNAPNAAVVSQSFVKKYFENEEVIGQTIQFGNMDGDLRLLHIVGVVGDVHDYGVDVAVGPTVYGNALQRLPSSSWNLVARATVEPGSLVPVMRETVRTLDPQLPLKFRTLDQVFSSSLDQRRFSLVIFGVFGVAALLLAAMGIYGVTAYVVTQRTREIGIRMALGAQLADVLKMVLRYAMTLVVIGTIVGLAGAYAITRVMSNLLFQVTPTDLLTFVAVPAVLLLVALVACLIPARRATKVDPLITLRYE
ncbi:MAG TPA: ABC transporter permease [Pyrinomonadaceae bacterium]|jgi:ABC-type antimicrobial peptide transport system permease subunit